MPWGDANATWRMRLVDGRDLIARRFAAGTGTDARRVAANMTVVARAGIPVPHPRIIEIDGTPWLITNHVDGAVGAAWLDTGARARTVARAMAGVRRQLLEIDRSAGARQGMTAAIDRPPRDSPAGDALDSAETFLSQRRLDVVFVHGDFAPINVIVDGDGNLSALLDFEHAHLGDPLEDVAWWCWVVRHHHPDAWRAAWQTFCAVAGVDPVEEGETIEALVVVELARRAAAAKEVDRRDRWLARAAEAAAWRP